MGGGERLGGRQCSVGAARIPARICAHRDRALERPRHGRRCPGSGERLEVEMSHAKSGPPSFGCQGLWSIFRVKGSKCKPNYLILYPGSCLIRHNAWSGAGRPLLIGLDAIQFQMRP